MLLRCTEGIDLILARTQLSVQMAPLSSSFPRLKSAFAAFRWLETPFDLALPFRSLCHRFPGFRLRHGAGGNPRGRALPRPSLEPLPHQLENRLPVLPDHLHPGPPPQHGEIDATETKARQEDVNAIAQRLIVQRFDHMRQRLWTVSLGPAAVHFGVRF